GSRLGGRGRHGGLRGRRRRGRALDRQREGQRADLDEILVLEDYRLGDRLAVHERSVSAPKVLNRYGVFRERKLGMLSAHLLATRPKMARLTAADLELRADQGNDLPLRLALNHDQLDFHGNRSDLFQSTARG